MTTTANRPHDSQPPFLDHNGIESALTYLGDCWPNQKLTAAQVEAWTDVLCQLRQGELRAVLAKSSSRYRPDPYEFLELVMQVRQAAVPIESRYNTAGTKALERVLRSPYDKSFDPRELPAVVKARESLAKASAKGDPTK